MNGWFKVHRKIFDSWVFADPSAFKLWCWLVGGARIDNGFVYISIGNGGSTITLKRGELVFGRFTAEQSLRISGSKLYRLLKKFENEKMIELKPNNHFTIITICNYELYQGDECDDWTADEQQVNNRRTTDEQQVNTIKKDKKEKKDKKDKNLLFQSSIEIYYAWHKKKFEIVPKIDGAQGKALNNILSYLKTLQRDRKKPDTDEVILKIWTRVFNEWDMLDPFLYKKTKLTDISSNITEIIKQLTKVNEKKTPKDQAQNRPVLSGKTSREIYAAE